MRSSSDDGSIDCSGAPGTVYTIRGNRWKNRRRAILTNRWNLREGRDQLVVNGNGHGRGASALTSGWSKGIIRYSHYRGIDGSRVPRARQSIC